VRNPDAHQIDIPLIPRSLRPTRPGQEPVHILICIEDMVEMRMLSGVPPAGPDAISSERPELVSSPRAMYSITEFKEEHQKFFSAVFVPVLRDIRFGLTTICRTGAGHQPHYPVMSCLAKQ
jgi:hypothetical protein